MRLAIDALLCFRGEVVPSAEGLTEDGLRQVRKGLMVHEIFNLAQMPPGFLEKNKPNG